MVTKRDTAAVIVKCGQDKNQIVFQVCGVISCGGVCDLAFQS